MDHSTIEAIASKFRTIRGRRVIMDRDLAEFYGVATRLLNSQVSRKLPRFPEDFAFRLTKEEATELLREESAPSPRRTGRDHTPRVFSPIGALVASSVLSTPKAIEISLQLVREIVAAAHDPAFGHDVHSELTDVEWRLAGKSGSPFEIPRIFEQGR